MNKETRKSPDTEGFYQTLGKRIRRLREAGGITQEQLANQVNLTRTSLINIEKGRQRVLSHTLVEIASALHVAPEALLTSNSEGAAMPSLDPEARRWIEQTIAASDTGEELCPPEGS